LIQAAGFPPESRTPVCTFSDTITTLKQWQNVFVCVQNTLRGSGGLCGFDDPTTACITAVVVH
jgi:hypothetical protein